MEIVKKDLIIRKNTSDSLMSTEFRTCPHCNMPGSKEILNEKPDTGSAFSLGENGIYKICHCDNPQCGKNFFVHGKVKVSTGYVSNIMETYFEYPIAKTIIHKSIPPNISDLYAEAIKCLNLGALNASSIMFRRVLEQVCDNKNSTGDNLPEKIESIIESTTLKRMMTLVKNFGVLANHDDRYDYEIEPNDVPKLQEFIEHLFQEVYITPHNLSDLESTLSNNKK